jgi:signal transduction histidine kinase
LVLAALLLTTIAGGLVTMWHTEATDALFTNLVDQNLASFQAAEELETTLLRQKGFLTYYYLDGNPEWLTQLESYHKAFLAGLNKARKSAHTEAMAEILQQIDSHYQNYLRMRERVITLYQTNQREQGASLHQELRQQFKQIYQFCERYKLIQEYAIVRAKSESQLRAKFLNRLAMTAMLSVACLGLLLAYILVKQILGPIRQLALEASREGSDLLLPDEIKALSRRVHSLMENVDQAQSQLERSHEQIIQSEKLALVGKLAAGVAHSIRNPLTSVKMRLFSLGRSLELSPLQAEDLQVISEEIRHIDTIVRHFLEFSRPPKLKMQKVSLSDVVDAALTLLHQRLESYGVKVVLQRSERLPETWADPEQLKEMLVNLLLNACDAMGRGAITLHEGKGQLPQLGRTAFLKVGDTGPGVPASIQGEIFQPFFSTKEEGTGLGLSIAARIIAEHGGWIDLISREGEGATFLITLPIREEEPWAPSL